MREKFQRFMQGRYGADELSRFLTMVGLILIVVNLFFRSVLLSYLVLAILIYCYYRMFSRNYSRRYAENQKFLSWRRSLLPAEDPRAQRQGKYHRHLPEVPYGISEEKLSKKAEQKNGYPGRQVVQARHLCCHI